MAEAKRFAVVTGANRGIGFGVVRQFLTVVLTAREKNKGLDALRRLKESAGFSDKVLFHPLDVSDSSSVASLAKFVKAQFGRLDNLRGRGKVYLPQDELAEAGLSDDDIFAGKATDLNGGFS